MGSGASSEAKYREERLRHLRGHDIDDSSSGRRPGAGSLHNASHRSSTARNRSVRAMAMLNHAREENSYISPEAFSSHISSSSRTIIPENEFNNSFNNILRSNSIESEGMGMPLISEGPGQEEDMSVSSAAQNGAIIYNAPKVNKFRMSLNLKLNLDEESEYTRPQQQSDDDKSKDVDLEQFSKSLIAVPLIADDDDGLQKKIEKIVETIQDSDHPEEMSGELGDVQYDDKGTLLVPVEKGGSVKVGLCEDGLVKPNNIKDKRGKRLPMKERLVMLCKLGSGASSAVYKALDLTDMRLVALKTIQMSEKEKRVQMVRELTALYKLLKENSRRELSQMPTIRRPEKYIVDFYDAFCNLEDGVVCLMIEYMDGGSLQDIVDQGGCDDEPTMANIAVQALKGLNFLHNSNQIHRDLKPGNFLISYRGEVKVADLGIMKQLSAKPSLARANTFVGTALYMSPERIDGKQYSYPSDIWAFGLSMLTIAIGRLPIENKGGYWTILHNIRDAPPPALPDTFSSEFRDFIDRCLKRDPKERHSCKQLLQHPFLRLAEAEDLSLGQIYDRSKAELHSIIRALHAHISRLKSEATERFSSSSEYCESATADHERILGNIYEQSVMDTLRKLLFNEDGKNDPRRFIRPRLANLAKQLHIPLEKLMMEATSFCESLEIKAEE